MTVGELIRKLADFDPGSSVRMSVNGSYGEVEGVNWEVRNEESWVLLDNFKKNV